MYKNNDIVIAITITIIVIIIDDIAIYRSFICFLFLKYLFTNMKERESMSSPLSSSYDTTGHDRTQHRAASHFSLPLHSSCIYNYIRVRTILSSFLSRTTEVIFRVRGVIDRKRGVSNAAISGNKTRPFLWRIP